MIAILHKTHTRISKGSKLQDIVKGREAIEEFKIMLANEKIKNSVDQQILSNEEFKPIKFIGITLHPCETEEFDIVLPVLFSDGDVNSFVIRLIDVYKNFLCNRIGIDRESFIVIGHDELRYTVKISGSYKCYRGYGLLFTEILVIG